VFVKKNIISILFILILTFFLGGHLAMANDEADLQAFIDNHVKLIAPLQKQSAIAYYDATQFGKSEDSVMVIGKIFFILMNYQKTSGLNIIVNILIH
jgi:hypothetical protein